MHFNFNFERKNDIKTHTILISACITLSVFLFSSCKEKIQHENFYSNVATRIGSSAKYSSSYNLTVYCGHDKRQCNNACVTINGVSTHLPCQGFGNLCVGSFPVIMEIISYNDYTATTLDSTALTNEDFFNMPSRSLFVEYDEKHNEVWLNIPAQFVYRDSLSRQFTFTGLFYSNSAYYANN